MAEKSKYTSLREWKRKEPNAYDAALRNGWINKICEMFGWKSFVEEIWTKEKIHECAIQCKTRVDFVQNFPQAYSAAIRLKILDAVCIHMPIIRNKSNSWTKQKCVKEAKKYNKIEDFVKNSPGACAAMYKNNWKKVCTLHMKKGHYTDKEILSDAKKYKTIKEWTEKSGSGIVSSARRRKIFAKCTFHMQKIWEPKHTNKSKQYFKNEVKKYDSIKKLKDDLPGVYQYIHKKGWAKEFFKNMRRRKKYSLQELMDDAKKYTTRIAWYKNSNKMYQAAQNEGKVFYNKCTKHMKLLKTKDDPKT